MQEYPSHIVSCSSSQHTYAPCSSGFESGAMCRHSSFVPYAAELGYGRLIVLNKADLVTPNVALAMRDLIESNGVHMQQSRVLSHQLKVLFHTQTVHDDFLMTS
eukprot:4979573-Amphidinium_carterae.1